MLALLLTLLALSIWLYQDAERRQMNSPVTWVVLLWLFGPLALAIYWTRRPLFAGEFRTGGSAWIGLRVFFLSATLYALLFAAVFTVWLSAIIPWGLIVAVLLTLSIFIGGSWLIFAALLTFIVWISRDPHAIEQGPTHKALVGLPIPTPGDRLLKAIFFAGLLAVFLLTAPTHPQWVDSVEWQTVPGRLAM